MPSQAAGLLRAATAVVLVGLGACADNPPAPIETRSGTQVSPSKSTTRPATEQSAAGKSTIAAGSRYAVQPGDTLYSIAFRYGIDVNALAARNQIDEPFTIYPGQLLVIDLTGLSASASTATKPASNPKPQKKSASPQSTENVSAVVEAPVAEPKKTPVKQSSKPANEPSTAQQVAAKPVSKGTFGPVARWEWPSAGRVARSYSDVLHKGLDIAGARGDLIRATAAGEVVYAGTGVKGYGLLLIVKHNEQFLSAYGHNDSTLVKEGTWVGAGQPIAQMGSSGTDTVKLHFEIRREGKPIDPVKLLPRR
jgi:lipoprotein NlpD